MSQATRNQVEAIITDMGWEPLDITNFWRLARLEHAAPGYIQRKTEAYWDKVIRRAERERRRHAKAC